MTMFPLENDLGRLASAEADLVFRAACPCLAGGLVPSPSLRGRDFQRRPSMCYGDFSTSWSRIFCSSVLETSDCGQRRI